jgi:hypothetical protein
MGELKRLLLATIQEIESIDTSEMSSTIKGELSYLQATCEDMNARMGQVHGDKWFFAIGTIDEATV